MSSQLMIKSVNKTPRNITQFKTIAFMTPSLNSIAFKTYPWQGIVSWSGILDSSSCWYAGPTIPPSLLRGEGGVLLKAFLWSTQLLCPGLQQEERLLLGWKKTSKQIDHNNTFIGGCSQFSNTAYAPQILKVLGQAPSLTVLSLLGGDQKLPNSFYPWRDWDREVLVFLAFHLGTQWTKIIAAFQPK